MTRNRSLIIYLVALISAIGGTLRYLEYILSQPSKWVILVLLSVVYALLILWPWVSRRHQRLLYLYFAVQTCILVVLTIVTTIEDFAAIPFMSLILIGMTAFPPKIGFRWIGIFSVIIIVSIIVFGSMIHGINPGWLFLNTLLNLTIFLAIGAFITVLRQLETARTEAEDARRESQELLAELQISHEQLQSYTDQAEELAVIAERNRLARELHDSVTQSLYSLTLFSEAARHSAEEQGLEGIEQQIKQIGVIGLQALKEMRLLVYELQPPELERDGLVRALRRRLEAVEGRAGVEARVEVEEFIRLPGSVEQELFRIALEALNNALKHSAAASVLVHLSQESACIEMEIVDDGVGFEPEAMLGHGGMGLKNIHERTERLGGTVTVHSKPGEGTSVKVVIEDCVGIEN